MWNYLGNYKRHLTIEAEALTHYQKPPRSGLVQQRVPTSGAVLKVHDDDSMKLVHEVGGATFVRQVGVATKPDERRERNMLIDIGRKEAAIVAAKIERKTWKK